MYFRIFALISFFALFSCSEVSQNEPEVQTTYGFGLRAFIEEFGEPDSMSAWVIDAATGDTLDILHFSMDDVEDEAVRFPIDAERELQVRVFYLIYQDDEAMAGGDQVFVSGETPEVPRPRFKPEVQLTEDTTVFRAVEWKTTAEIVKRDAQDLLYMWDLDGDGLFEDTLDVNREVAQAFDETGTYVLHFRAEDPLGLADEDSVIIDVVPAAPQLSAAGDTTVSVGDSISLFITIAWDDSTRIDEAYLSWSWADESDSSEVVNNRVFVWDSAATYVVVAEVEDAWGNTSFDSVVVEVLQDAPEVQVGEDVQIRVADSVAFTQSVTQQFGSITEMRWDFDGDTSGGVWDTVFTDVEASFSHTYIQAGEYVTLFMAQDDDGNVSYASRTIDVSNGAPEVTGLMGNVVVSIGDTVTLWATMNDVDGIADLVLWQWDYDGDGEYDTTVTNVSQWRAEVQIVWNEAGAYAPVLRVEDRNGVAALSTDLGLVQVNVLQGEPLVSLNSVSDTTIGIGEGLSLSVSASDPNQDGSLDAVDGQIVSYGIDFDGDGEFDQSVASPLSFVPHVYENVSADTTYAAEFCAVDDDDQISCIQRNIRVINRAPVIEGIDVSATALSINDTITVSLQTSDADNNAWDICIWSVIPTTGVQWTDSLACAEVQTLVFTQNGSYHISVTLSDDWGASDTDEFDIEVLSGLPEVNAGNDTTIFMGDGLLFIPDAADPNGDAEDGTIIRARWDFNGDGVYDVDVTDISNQAWTYDANESADTTYVAEFCATDNDSQEVCDTRNVRVLNQAPTIASFTANYELITVHDEVSFNPGSVEDPGGSQDNLTCSYSLSGNSGGVVFTTDADCLHPGQTIRFDSAGTTTVSFRVQDEWGADSVLSVTIEVITGAPEVTILYPNPDTTIAINQALALLGQAADPNGTLADGSIASYSWDLDGDRIADWTGINSVEQSTSFSSEGVHWVQFCATDYDGVESCDSRSIIVTNTAPVIDSIVNLTGDSLSLHDSVAIVIGLSDAENNLADSISWRAGLADEYGVTYADTYWMHRNDTLFLDTAWLYLRNSVVRVEFTAYDQSGASSVQTLDINVVQEDAPDLSFIPDTLEAVSGQSVRLANEITAGLYGNNESITDMRRIVPWNWEYVPMNPDADSIIFTVPAAAGIYAINWSATDSDEDTQNRTTYLVVYSGFVDARDGKIYYTDTIGSQVWMLENLNYDTLNGTGSWCLSNNPDNCDTYGRLYTWAAANGFDLGADTVYQGQPDADFQGICPDGWYLPSIDSWNELGSFIDGEHDVAGNTCGGGDDWCTSGKYMVDESWTTYGFIPDPVDPYNFGALPGGYRSPTGSFTTSKAFWWTTHEGNLAYGSPMSIYGTQPYLYSLNYVKTNAFSVRCYQPVVP
jgi:uncharacterized protein (TIGR02145 family)